MTKQFVLCEEILYKLQAIERFQFSNAKTHPHSTSPCDDHKKKMPFWALYANHGDMA